MCADDARTRRVANAAIKLLISPIAVNGVAARAIEQHKQPPARRRQTASTVTTRRRSLRMPPAGSRPFANGDALAASLAQCQISSASDAVCVCPLPSPLIAGGRSEFDKTAFDGLAISDLQS